MSSPLTVDLIITPAGSLRCVYDESIDLAALGTPQIQRASHVEPGPDGGRAGVAERALAAATHASRLTTAIAAD